MKLEQDNVTAAVDHVHIKLPLCQTIGLTSLMLSSLATAVKGSQITYYLSLLTGDAMYRV